MEILSNCGCFKRSVKLFGNLSKCCHAVSSNLSNETSPTSISITSQNSFLEAVQQLEKYELDHYYFNELLLAVVIFKYQ